MNPTRTIQRRIRLHALYGAHSGLVDASRLAHLNGPTTRLTPQELATLWSNAPTQIGASEVRSHLYVHVPFCKSICSFCNYDRLRPSSVQELAHYTDQVCAEIEAIAPHVDHLDFSSIYFGGGTPSVLTAPQLDRVMSCLDTHMNFHPLNGRFMEFDPAVLNAQKLAVARSHGFDRFSFGIQSLDTQVNADHNRGPQSRSLLAKRFGELHEAGIDDASCDVLLGLAGTTPAQMLAEIAEIIEVHRPGHMHIFMITPTDAYVHSHFGGDRDRFWSHLKTFADGVLPGLRSIAAAHGYDYEGGSGHQFRLIRRAGQRAASNRKRGYVPMSHIQGAPVHVLGLGPSARSSIFGQVQYQNYRDDDAWYAQGCRIRAHDEARIHLCSELRDEDRIDPDLFRRLHQSDFATRFPMAHVAWKQLGLYAEDGIRLIPQDRRDRTQALMWLVEEEKIEAEIARHFGLPTDEEGIRRLIAPLNPGQVLPGGARLTDVSGRVVQLSVQGTPYGFRVAPGWQESEAPRLVATTAVSAEHTGPAKQAVSLIRKLFRKNRRHKTA